MAAGFKQLISSALDIDSYDRKFQAFWRGAIGDLVLVPRANCNKVQNAWKSGLRWFKFASRTSLRLLNDDPYRPARRALSTDEFEPSYGLISRVLGIIALVAFVFLILGPNLASAQLAFPQSTTQKATTIDPPSPNDLREFNRLLSDPKMVEWLRQSAERMTGDADANTVDRRSLRQQLDRGLVKISGRVSALRTAWQDLSIVPQTISEIWRAQVSREETLRSITFTIIFLFVGAGLEWLYWQYFGTLLLRFEVANTTTLGARMRSALLRMTLITAAMLVFGAGSIGTFLTFDWPDVMRRIVLNFLIAVIIFRVLMALVKFVLAPHVPSLRFVPLSSGPARRLYHWTAILAFVSLVGLTVSDTFTYLASLQQETTAADSAALAVAVLSVICISALLVLAVWRMSKLAGKTRAGLHAKNAYRYQILPAALSVLIVVTALLWLIGANEVKWSMIIVGLIVPLIAMVGRLINHLFNLAEGEQLSFSDNPGLADTEQQIAKTASNGPGRYVLHRPVTVRLSRFVLTIIAMVALGATWGVSLWTLSTSNTFSGWLFGVVVNITFTLLIADLVWVWAKAAIDRRMADFNDMAAVTGGEGGGVSGPEARMATLLPLFRKILTAFIFIMVALSILSSIGINVAPLLAGAGVVGVAIGFGAQSLVRDIVSGIFYLLDDAFRVGEYIEMGNLRGTVESMSLRSLRVRHHRGAVHTIPFGELTSLTNYSRDWVIMKLEFRVPFDTDLQLIKKLIKQVGVELKAHENYGKHFIQPLKSQGVRRMEEFNMVIAAKFMCTPGEQWLIRRDAYQKIRDVFEANGIELAQRSVKVEVMSDKPLTPEEKKAVSGAAQEALERETPAAPPSDEP